MKALRDPPNFEFPAWLERTSQHLIWHWQHQTYIYKFLAKITDEDGGRLMIFMPPRHSKSETVTIHYTAWRICRDPALNVILACYNQKLANRFSRRIKRLVAATNVEISKEIHGAEEWETKQGGGVRAVGVGGGVTGFGASLIVIDDPIKSRAQANSVTLRQSTWEWFNDDIYTRLEPAASIILIQTRWHEDDLSGRLLEAREESGEAWEVVKLPAIAIADDPLGRPAGAALCPDRYDAERLEKMRRSIGTRSFASLYQQDPLPDEATLFKPRYFTRFADKIPDGLRCSRGYDLAVSTKTSADYTASVRCAFDVNGDLYIADGFRGRIEYPEQRRYVIDCVRSEANTVHGIEAALHGRAFVQDLRRVPEIRGRPLRAVKVDADKYTRALAWANLAEEGRVVLVRGVWNHDFIEEACRFTGKGDKHDDQIDAVSLAVSLLRDGKMKSFGA